MNDKAKIDALRAALQFFIDRCDSGLAQSKTTYAKFKDVLALTADASEQAPAAPVADTGAVAEMEARKDAAYYERNQVVAALAKCFPSGKARTAIEGWSEDWHGCVYIDLPTGQVSWHYHDSQAHLFNSIPHYLSAWDGHDTDEKYRRLAALRAAPASPAPTADSAADARDAGALAIACTINQKLGEYIAGRTYLLPGDLAALQRFHECAMDFDSGGHDVSKEAMARLREIGLVENRGFGRHQVTSFGDYVLGRAVGADFKLPLKTYAEYNEDSRRAAMSTNTGEGEG